MRFLVILSAFIMCNFSMANDFGVDFQNHVRSLIVEDQVSSNSITRAEAVARARAILEYRYQPSEENLSPAGMINSCEGQNTWLRPWHLYGSAGKTVSSIPYKWGGYFLDISTFERNLAAGKAVGDVCTCRDNSRGYCVDDRTIGLDCSGFVSHIWRTDYYFTSTMHEISEQIEWEEILPGDAINKPGDHVLLVTGVSEDRNYVHGIESSTRCEGVCEVNLRIYDLKREGYFPIRYIGIRD